MQVHVSRALQLQLQAPEDFKSFKLVIDLPKTARSDIAAALAPAGRIENEGTAWISEAWLRGASSLGSDEAWQAGVSGMIAYARKFGWVDDATASIRAHIEWAGDRASP